MSLTPGRFVKYNDLMKLDVFGTSRFIKFLTQENLDLFRIGSNDGFHWGKLFFHLFGEYYSRFQFEHSFQNEDLIESLIRKYSVKPGNIIRSDRAKNNNFHEVDYEWSEILLILKEGLFFVIYDNRVEILYSLNIPKSYLQELIGHIEVFKLGSPIKQFHMVQSSRGSFQLSSFDLKPFSFDIGLHYNEDFQDIHKLIYNSLTSKNKNGIVLLHGKFGTGKTYYLRHLISTIDRNFIYFPLDMVEAINKPEFIPFISSVPDSVLILEDCESLLVTRESGSHNISAISNLLNIGDGLLADALNVNVICTFNAGIKKIDDALLRKGRLLARYEFKELETTKAQALANNIGKTVKIENPMTLSEVYNLEQRSFENNKTRAVGFNSPILS
jgi:hypothetical protein